MRKYVLIVFGLLLIISCGQEKMLQNKDVIGLWKIELQVDKDSVSIPFFLEIIGDSDSILGAVWNGEEKIIHHDIVFHHDTLVLTNPFFNSSLYLKFQKNKITGYWEDGSRVNYTIPLTGMYNLNQRFSFEEQLSMSADGKWEVVFSPGTEDAYKAIGLFSSDENSMKGTFLTETGDYRFLEGGFAGNQLKLSTFDGSHAFLFEADLIEDTLRGKFWSGKHWSEPFIAWRNDSATLADPFSLTTANEPDTRVSVRFQDANGKMVSLEDSAYLNKPVLLQLMGTWCPNCIDESTYLSNVYDSIAMYGVEVLALCFEREDYNNSIANLRKVKEELNIPYTLLYAGGSDKEEATKLVPWLSQVKSYPTLIFLTSDHRIVKTHTGFYGQGTGKYFDRQTKLLMHDIEVLGQL